MNKLRDAIIEPLDRGHKGVPLPARLRVNRAAGGPGRIRTCDPGVMSRAEPDSRVFVDDRFVFRIGAIASATSTGFRLCSPLVISVLIPIADPGACRRPSSRVAVEETSPLR